MQDTRNVEIIDELNGKAGRHYDQGEFREALESWRQLLLLDPSNERALEGVKLCEVLVDAAPAAASPPDAPAPIALGATPGPGGEDFGELLSQAPADSAKAGLGAPENFDFDLSAIENIAADGPTAPASPAEAVAGAGEFEATLPPAETEALPLAPRQVADTTEGELQTRIRELYKDALTVFERGDGESAMIILSRLFILDEHNEAAEKLRSKIRETLEPSSEDADEAEGLLPDYAIPSPDRVALREGALDLDPPMDDPAAPVEDDRRFGTEWAPPEEREAQPEPVDDAEPGLARKLAGMVGTKMLKWVIGAVIGVLLFIGKMTLSAFLGSGDVPDDPNAASAPAHGAQATQPAASTAPDPVETPPAPAPVELSPEERARKLADALARGAAAYEAEDYAQAIVAYGQAVKLDAGQMEAIRRLEIAGERYQEQKEIEAKWAAVIRAFNDGSFREAMTLLYRLPEGQDKARIDRYKVNGWYNMGLQALQGGDCNGALEHFKEARALNRSDAGVRQGMDLVAQCRTGGGLAYRTVLQSLAPRGLDD